MTIQVNIPLSIVLYSKESGWSELETLEYFSRYLREEMNDVGGNFEQGFKDYLQDLVEEDLEDYNSGLLYGVDNNQ